MPDWFIEQHALDAVRGRALYYPAAGQDWHDPVRAFSGIASYFVFCDLGYAAGMEPTSFVQPGGCHWIDWSIAGDAKSQIEAKLDAAGRSYRDIAPSIATGVLEDKSGRRICVKFRRGFGQYGMREFGHAELGIFVHRGDSPGEGGSNVYYLANRLSRHPPIGRLFSQIADRLGQTGLVISDGSNVGPRFLKRFHRSMSHGPDAYGDVKGETYSWGGWSWNCVGYLRGRNGPTLVWAIRREGTSSTSWYSMP